MESETSLDNERSRRSAAGVLRRVFGHVTPGIRFRLWDGSEGTIGRPDGSWTLILRDRESFRAAFAGKNSRLMAEAFIDDRIDVEGDLYSALRIANQVESLELGFFDKLGLWLDLRGV
jgi:hypothetical protein